MNNRLWLRLLLLAFALFAPSRIATAQNLPSHAPAKPSHHDLPGGLDLDNPQEMMAERLKELHDLHELQDQVSELLQDREFLQSLQQLPEDKLKRLREKMMSGAGLGKDQNWDDLLRKAASKQKLGPKHIDMLRNWADRAEDKPPSAQEPNARNGQAADTPATPPADPNALNSTASTPPGKPPEPSFYDRIQDEGSKWLMDHLDDVGGDVLDAMTGMGNTANGGPFADLLRSIHQLDLSEWNVSEKAMRVAGYLPKMGEFLHEQGGAWNEVRSLFKNTPVPALSRFSAASASLPSPTQPSRDSWVPVLLSLLMLGLIILLVFRMAARSQARTDSGGDNWRLGPWPVSPDAVSTRQDVVRAFEYVALLCLGPAAGACHHRELAERLAEQENDNPKRRQAAETLAWLYEQARYAPESESLSPEELTDARHALRSLAGVTAL